MNHKTQPGCRVNESYPDNKFIECAQDRPPPGENDPGSLNKDQNPFEASIKDLRAIRSIDTIAHKTAVQTGGRTLAVLGSGLDVIYPGENRRLAEDICQKGTLISEFPLGTQPDRGNFPG
ncbi:MAG: hypothetical protein CMG68_03540, partial [Candidatus Marinimicrobia bacterium]|nr:hypothetical protein [Candidatus Neomarinimicrobiota bacterium]